jgi:hypothetical protein
VVTRLFDPAATTARACPVNGCGAIRLPQQTGLIPTCQHDLDRAHGYGNRRRPKMCVNRADPATVEIPF